MKHKGSSSRDSGKTSIADDPELRASHQRANVSSQPPQKALAVSSTRPEHYGELSRIACRASLSALAVSPEDSNDQRPRVKPAPAPAAQHQHRRRQLSTARGSPSLVAASHQSLPLDLRTPLPDSPGPDRETLDPSPAVQLLDFDRLSLSLSLSASFPSLVTSAPRLASPILIHILGRPPPGRGPATVQYRDTGRPHQTAQAPPPHWTVAPSHLVRPLAATPRLFLIETKKQQTSPASGPVPLAGAWIGRRLSEARPETGPQSTDSLARHHSGHTERPPSTHPTTTRSTLCDSRPASRRRPKISEPSARPAGTDSTYPAQRAIHTTPSIHPSTCAEYLCTLLLIAHSLTQGTGLVATDTH